MSGSAGLFAASPPVPPGVALRPLEGAALRAALPDLARLRIAVFREWPYLYDGDARYEERYLAALADAPDAVIVGAFAGPDGETGDPGRMVGAATALPLAHADPAFRAAFEAAGHDPARWYYLAESVLDPRHRGRGIGVAFFAARERAGSEAGYDRFAFCAVERSERERRRQAAHSSAPLPAPLEGFWRRRGYAPTERLARYAWREVGAHYETEHVMRFWEKQA